MNPKLLDSVELITLEEQSEQVIKQSRPSSYLYHTARRLKSLMQLELIRRGIFDRQKKQLREATNRP